ncbi:MAG: uroporphyrinogen-III C-methyltransferase, partial [Planctomycetota bacterium]
VGAGAIGTARVDALLRVGARVRVVAPETSPRVDELARAGAVELRRRRYRRRDLAGCRFALACVDDPVVGRRVARHAARRGVLRHVADVPELCDIVFPAVHHDGPLTVAVSTSGEAPGLAGRLRDHLAHALPPRAGEVAGRIGALRRRVRALLPRPDQAGRRMRTVAAVARNLDWPSLAALEPAAAEAWIETPPRPPEVQASAVRRERRRGPRVHLVGAGPGGAQHLTERARELVASADVVLADRLVPPDVLALVTGELAVAEKLPGLADGAQRSLEERALEDARSGRSVVRLKTGDPALFGRAGEELRALADGGVDVEVVPGVASPFAAAAAAGVSLTERGVADQLLILSGQGRGGADTELPRYRSARTLALLMGVGTMERTVAGLRANGHPADLPVAVVASAGRPDEVVVRTTLEGAVDAIRANGVRAPAVVLVGWVAAPVDSRSTDTPRSAHCLGS